MDTPERRLKIGYLSPFFGTCADAHYILPLLAHHDRKQFEIFCYTRTTRDDELTERMRPHCDHWLDIRRLGMAESAELIRGHGIDVLLNMSLPADECLRLMANRLAPIQIAWLTFASCTTGLKTMDYRISDPYLDPVGTDELCYAEKTVRLPETAWCYDPLFDSPPVTALPALANGSITFGSLNRLSKINPSVVSAWAEILRAVPGSRLHILAGLGSHRQRLLDQFRDLLVDPRRIEFIAKQSRLDYLKQYGRIDITLDTFPFSGHTTSLDSFWMGVPVVTLAGRTVVGRAGLSPLTNLGLPELIARTPEQYVQIAADLAGDLPRLADLRRTLRRADAGVAADGCPAFRPQYRSGVPADVAELVRAGAHRQDRAGEFQATIRIRLVAPPGRAAGGGGGDLSPDPVAAAQSCGALHLLGMLAAQAGRLDAAVELIRRAVRSKPDYAEAHSNLGNVLRQGQLDEAIAAYRQAIPLKPDLANARNLANA